MWINYFWTCQAQLIPVLDWPITKTACKDTCGLYMLPLALPSTNFIQQASTMATILQPCANVPLPSIQPLVPVCTWSHSRGCQELVIWSTHQLYCCSMWRWGLSCGHGPYQDQPITFFLIVFLVFRHWIVLVWIRVLCSLRLVGLAHATAIII